MGFKDFKEGWDFVQKHIKKLEKKKKIVKIKDLKKILEKAKKESEKL